MATIRKEDFVEVISGNDRGKRGRVLRVIPARNRVVVQGVNLRWKHLRKSQQNPQGGRVRRETPVHISNVMVYDEERGTRTRIGVKVVKGKKLRIGRRTGVEIGAQPSKEEPAARKKTSKKTAKKAAGKVAKKATPKPTKKKDEE